MKDIYEIIELVKTRPPMYIGDSTLSTMDIFLAGAGFGLSLNEIKESPDFMDFHIWVRDKFELPPLSVGYKTIILEQCNGDEEIGLKMFFDLIEEFKNENLLSNQE